VADRPPRLANGRSLSWNCGNDVLVARRVPWTRIITRTHVETTGSTPVRMPGFATAGYRQVT
jgi:hypothetical protein